MQISKQQAEQIIDVLIAQAGFSCDDPDEREHTVGLITSGEHRELRICYGLGFGGKLWMSGRQVYVNTYRETETPALKERIMKINTELAGIMGTEPVLW